MNDREKYGGLCSTCGNGSTCTYRRKTGDSILFCDEFKGGLTMEKKDDGEIILSPESLNDKIGVDGERGLCPHCKNLEHCTYPKPEGGVWHCDEYK